MIHLDQVETCEVCYALVLKDNAKKHSESCSDREGWMNNLINRYLEY